MLRRTTSWSAPPCTCQPRRRGWSGNPAADAAGYTLVELLVALAIGGIIVGSIFQLIVGHGRFVERQSAREEVQQNTRAALELIGSELRTLPGGDALLHAAADSITMRVVRTWGIVCALPGGSSLDVAVPVVAGLSYTLNTGTGLVANVRVGGGADDWTNAPAITAVGAASSTCNGTALQPGVERRTVSLASMPQNQAGTRTPTVGNIVYLFDQVTYRSGSSAGTPGTWIQRRIGNAGSGNQPFAGPIGDTGLRFQYFTSASSAPLATPVGDGARPTVTRIAVVVESVSRNSLGETQETKSDTVVVALRNRI